MDQAIYLPRPGTTGGPCVDESCGHDHCGRVRACAAEVCAACAQPLGYGRGYYRDYRTGRATHKDCWKRLRKSFEGTPASQDRKGTDA